MLRFGLPRFVLPAFVLFALLGLAPAGPARADVTGLRATPSTISPNGDGQRDRTVLSWTVAGGVADSIHITVRRSGSNPLLAPLRTFLLTARPVGRDSLEWDGRDGGGSLLPDTLYSVRLTERDNTGAIVAEAVVAVELDTTAPPVPVIAGPADTAVTDTSYAFAGIAAAADTVILFRAGVPFDTLAVDLESQSFGINVRLAEGDNLLAVQSYDRGYNFSPQTTAINVRYVNTPDLASLRALPDKFSPNGDGILDSTRVTATIDAPTSRLSVVIRKGALVTNAEDTSLPVTVLNDAPAPAGAHVFVWDGRDSVGTVVGDGAYFFRVFADSQDVSGAAIPSRVRRTSAVTVDNTPPAAPTIASPAPARTIRGSVILRVKTLFADSLFTRRDGTLISHVATAAIATTDVSVPLAFGDNAITFQASDLAGNKSAVAGPFIVRFETPVGFHAPERFGRGDAFAVNLTAPARSVVIELFTLRGQPVRRLFSSQSSSRYELPWDLDDDAGRSVGDGPYVARLRVTFSDGSVEESKAAVVVVK
ncbi:MAG: hypothetical protein ABI960_01175 [Candidatus Eisenbacteria bacterium]